MLPNSGETRQEARLQAQRCCHIITASEYRSLLRLLLAQPSVPGLHIPRAGDLRQFSGGWRRLLRSRGLALLLLVLLLHGSIMERVQNLFNSRLDRLDLKFHQPDLRVAVPIVAQVRQLVDQQLMFEPELFQLRAEVCSRRHVQTTQRHNGTPTAVRIGPRGLVLPLVRPDVRGPLPLHHLKVVGGIPSAGVHLHHHPQIPQVRGRLLVSHPVVPVSFILALRLGQLEGLRGLQGLGGSTRPGPHVLDLQDLF
mmetsp:Transcript_55995/g.128506  ORF Transcript_55995/g.128506 Transcript_55995/m.128506 type:complete len:253 (-) Transcript_55995:146-904(-)